MALPPFFSEKLPFFLRFFTKGLIWGLGVFLTLAVIFAGYWASAVGVTHVDTGTPLTNAGWNGLVDVVNNLQTSVTKLSTLKATINSASKDALTTNITCTEGWAWVICFNPVTGKWYHDNSPSNNQITNDPYTNYPAALKSTDTICKAYWINLTCINPNNGDMAWITSGSTS